MTINSSATKNRGFLSLRSLAHKADVCRGTRTSRQAMATRQWRFRPLPTLRLNGRARPGSTGPPAVTPTRSPGLEPTRCLPPASAKRSGPPNQARSRPTAWTTRPRPSSSHTRPSPASPPGPRRPVLVQPPARRRGRRCDCPDATAPARRLHHGGWAGSWDGMPMAECTVPAPLQRPAQPAPPVRAHCPAGGIGTLPARPARRPARQACLAY
jgi:hypothetical protein